MYYDIMSSCEICNDKIPLCECAYSGNITYTTHKEFIDNIIEWYVTNDYICSCCDNYKTVVIGYGSDIIHMYQITI